MHEKNVGADWRRSRSRAGQGNRAEMAVIDDGTRVVMRNSTTPETVLVLDAGQWTDFIETIETGALNHPV